jgi:hypothetical protein
LTKESLPYWGALAAIVALVAGGGAAATKTYHSRLVARTARLLAVSSSLDPSEGKFQSSGLTIDGPSIRLRAYLDGGES